MNPNDTDLSSPAIIRKDNFKTKIKYWDNYRKKDFTKINLQWHKSTDDIYALLICDLDMDDSKGQTVNEIGIYNCTHVYKNNDPTQDIIEKKDFSLYAKANINAINKSPLNNHSAFRIAYKVFI